MIRTTYLLSELIEKLSDILEKHGDASCVIEDADTGWALGIDGDTVRFEHGVFRIGAESTYDKAIEWADVPDFRKEPR